MKDLYRLMQFEFQTSFKETMILCVGALVIPYFLMRHEMKDIHTHAVFERFEDVYASAGSSFIFIILFTLLCLSFLKSFYARYWGSKSIYTMVTLPVKRESLYFGKLFAFVISAVFLLACQLVSVFWSYYLYISKIEGFNDAQFVMHNGLFLAFIRSDFLRLLFPLTIDGLISSMSLLVILATGLFYGVLCERSKRYWGYVIIAIACVLIYRFIKLRMGAPLNLYYEPLPNLYMNSAVLLAISGYFIWHSMTLLKKGAITS